MNALHAPFGARGVRRSNRLPNVGGPEHLVRQIAITELPVPAQAYRGHSSLLIACRGAGGTEAASSLVQGMRPLDAVHRLECPVADWADVVDPDAAAARWLARRVMQRIDACDPAVVVVLLAAHEDDAMGQAVVRRLVEWGVQVPVGVLRAREGGGAEWRIVPHAIGLAG